jgi:DnaK suppressor protein
MMRGDMACLVRGVIVKSEADDLDKSFIEKQQRLLLALREALRAAADRDEGEETASRSEGAGAAREYEDDAQRLAALELEGNLVVRDASRLERVNRALKKIDEGTYGLSDRSGRPIPRQRLEAVPESIFTLAEEQTQERAASPPRY